MLRGASVACGLFPDQDGTCVPCIGRWTLLTTGPPGKSQVRLLNVVPCGSLLFLFLRGREGEQRREAGVNEEPHFCLSFKIFG